MRKLSPKAKREARAREKAAKTQLERAIAIAEAREQERRALQREQDREGVRRFVASIDAGRDVPGDAVLATWTHTDGRANYYGVHMNSLRAFCAAVRRLLD